MIDEQGLHAKNELMMIDENYQNHNLNALPPLVARFLGSPALWVYLIAIAIRVLFVFETRSIPAFRTPTPGMDIDLYWQSAQLLLKGANTGSPYFELMMCSSPIYPYWLAFWQWIIGTNMFTHRLLAAGITSLSSVFVVLMIKKLSQSRWIAIMSGLLWATLPSLVYFDTVLYKASLALFLFVLLIALVLSVSNDSSHPACILKGGMAAALLIGLYFLQMATVLYILPVIVYFISNQRMAGRKRFTLLVTLTGLYFAVCIPYHFRHHFNDSAYPWSWPQKGIHFRIGFNEKANGAYARLNNIPPWPYGHLFVAKMTAEVQTGEILTPAASDRFYIRQGLSYIGQHPLGASRLVFRKAFLFFSNYEIKGVDDLYFIKQQSRIMAWLPFGLGILLILAVPGVLHLWITRKFRLLILIAGLLLALLIADMTIFISWRYRLQNVLPLILLAAFGMAAIHDHLNDIFKGGKPLKNALTRISVLVVLPMVIGGWITYITPVTEKTRKNYFRSAKTNAAFSRKAEQLLAKSDLASPMNLSASPEMLRRATLLRLLHRDSAAYQIYRDMFAANNFHTDALHHYLVYLMWLGEYDQAKDVVLRIKQDKGQKFLATVERRFKGIEKQAYIMFVKNKV